MLQQQYTGYVPQGQPQGVPMSYQAQQPQQQFPVPTGYAQQPFPGQNIPQQGPQQSMQTGQQPAQLGLPQRTGQTSAEMAQSFQGTSAAAAQPAKPTKTGSKIPTIRLSFITAQDQAKFEQLFKSAVGDGQALSGENRPWLARIVLTNSRRKGKRSSVALEAFWRCTGKNLVCIYLLDIDVADGSGRSRTRPSPASFSSRNLRWQCISATLNWLARSYHRLFPTRSRMKCPAWST